MIVKRSVIQGNPEIKRTIRYFVFRQQFGRQIDQYKIKKYNGIFIETLVKEKYLLGGDSLISIVDIVDLCLVFNLCRLLTNQFGSWDYFAIQYQG